MLLQSPVGPFHKVLKVSQPLSQAGCCVPCPPGHSLVFPDAPTPFVPLNAGVSKSLKLEERWEGRWERHAGAGRSKALKSRSKPWDCEDGGEGAGDLEAAHLVRSSLWDHFDFREWRTGRQRKAGRSKKFLAQEECVKVQERCQQRAWQEPKTPKDLSAAPGQRGAPASRWDEARDVGRGQIWLGLWNHVKGHGCCPQGLGNGFKEGNDN